MTQAKIAQFLQTNGTADKIEVNNPSPSKRRIWTAKQKLNVLKELEEIKLNGADVGTFLRKHALFSSTVSLWKKQRNEGSLGSEGKKRGPKTKRNPEVIENERLQIENGRLLKKLETAHRIIELQKKVAAMFEVEELGMAKS